MTTKNEQIRRIYDQIAHNAYRKRYQTLTAKQAEDVRKAAQMFARIVKYGKQKSVGRVRA